MIVSSQLTSIILLVVLAVIILTVALYIKNNNAKNKFIIYINQVPSGLSGIDEDVKKVNAQFAPYKDIEKDPYRKSVKVVVDTLNRIVQVKKNIKISSLQLENNKKENFTVLDILINYPWSSLQESANNLLNDLQSCRDGIGMIRHEIDEIKKIPSNQINFSKEMKAGIDDVSKELQNLTTLKVTGQPVNKISNDKEIMLDDYSKIYPGFISGRIDPEIQEKALILETIRAHETLSQIQAWIASARKQINNWNQQRNKLISSISKVDELIKNVNGLVEAAEAKPLPLGRTHQEFDKLVSKVVEIRQQVDPLDVANIDELSKTVSGVNSKLSSLYASMQNWIRDSEEYKVIYNNIARKIGDINSFLKENSITVIWEESFKKLDSSISDFSALIPPNNLAQSEIEKNLPVAQSIMDKLITLESLCTTILKQAKQLLVSWASVLMQSCSDDFRNIDQLILDKERFHEKNWDDVLNVGSFGSDFRKFSIDIAEIKQININKPVKETLINLQFKRVINLDKEIAVLIERARKIKLGLDTLVSQTEQYKKDLSKFAALLATINFEMVIEKNPGDVEKEIISSIKTLNEILKSLDLKDGLVSQKVDKAKLWKGSFLGVIKRLIKAHNGLLEEKESKLQELLGKLDKYSPHITDQIVVQAKRVRQPDSLDLDRFNSLSDTNLQELLKIYNNIIARKADVDKALKFISDAIVKIKPKYDEFRELDKKVKDQGIELQRRLDRSWPPCVVIVSDVRKRYEFAVAHKKEIADTSYTVDDLSRKHEDLVVEFIGLLSQINRVLGDDDIDLEKLVKIDEKIKTKISNIGFEQIKESFESSYQIIKSSYDTERNTNRDEAAQKAIKAMKDLLDENNPAIQFQYFDHSIDQSITAEQIIAGIVGPNAIVLGNVTINKVEGITVLGDLIQYIESHTKPTYSEKVKAKEEIQSIQKELSKGSASSQSFIEDRIGNIKNTLPDVFDVVWAFFTKGPLNAAGEALKKIVERVRVGSK